jgi:tRNA (cmo5U34)-methyltransferase
MSDNSSFHHSNEYDSQIRHTIPFYENFHTEATEIIKCTVPNPSTWLDSGCGTGNLTQLALSFFPNTAFYLSDPSKGMLEQAKAKLGKYQNIHFLEPMQTTQIPETYNEKHDIVTAIQSHHYLKVSDRNEVSRRCYDLLRKDGIFITFENTKPLTDKGIEIGKKHWKEFQIREGKTEEAAQAQIARFNIEYFPITIEDHLRLYRSIGFRVVELFWYSYMQSGYYCIK